MGWRVKGVWGVGGGGLDEWEGVEMGLGNGFRGWLHGMEY